MKTNFILFILLLSVCWSCDFASIDSGISGNGNVVEKERAIKSFHGIVVANGIDVFITQTDEEKLVLIADENLHDLIITDVENGILKISSKQNIRRASSLRINLNYKFIESIKISSAGDVKGETKLVTDDLVLHLSSAGDLDLDIEANKIDCKISSSGDVNLRGKTTILNAELSSAGDLNAYDLISEECVVRVSSAGNAKVYATKLFDLEASSAGDIFYKGDGIVENQRTSSAGEIRKED